MFGHGAIQLVVALIIAVVGYALSLVSVFVLALIIDALAPSFDGQKDRIQAFKVAAYANTAAWVFGVLGIVPILGLFGLFGLLAGLYGIYLLYTGIPKLMKSPKEKSLGYTVVTVLCSIVFSIVITAVASAVGGAVILGAVGGQIAASRTSDNKIHLGDGQTVDLGKIEAAGRQQLESATGKTVPSVPAETLKGLWPEAVSGFQRTGLESNSGGAGGMSIATAAGDYQKDGASFRLAVTDLGAMAGMAAMANAVNAESTKETATGYERTGKIGGRLTTEEWDREAKSGRYSILVGDRFTVEANGNADSVDVLKQAVASVDVGRLEGLAR